MFLFTRSCYIITLSTRLHVLIIFGSKHVADLSVRFCNINIEGRTLCILLVECCELTWISHSTFLPFLKHNVQTSCSDHPARSSIVPNINVPVHITPKDITAVYEKRCMSLGDCTSGCFLPPPHPILFKHTDLNIAFRATNTLQQELSEKQYNTNPSGI